MSSDGKGTNKLAVFTLIAVVFVWGLDFVGVEYCTAHMSTMLIATFKLVLGGVIVLAFCLIKYKGLHFEKKDISRVIILGLMLAGYMNVESYGIGKISSPTASLILAIVPVIGLLADRVLNNVKITGVRVAGIVGSIVGVALLVLTTGESLGGSASGVIAICIGALIWASYIIVSKDIFEKYNLMQALAVILLTSGIVSIPFVFVFDHPIYCDPDPILFAILIGTTLFSTILAEWLYAYSISKLSITMVSMAENIIPLVTVIFAWILLGTTLNTLQIIGGLIIIGSVTIITVKE